jgi:hypothetical protein
VRLAAADFIGRQRPGGREVVPHIPFVYPVLAVEYFFSCSARD